MIAIRVFAVVFFNFSAVLTLSCAAKILGVFHVHSRSHHVIGTVILKALAERGHQITMLSPFPLSKSIQNYRDINLNEKSDVIQAFSKDLIQDFHEKPVLEAFALLLNRTSQQTELVFQNDQVQNLIQAEEEKFDVVIMDWFFNEAHLIFGDIFDAPIILVSSFGSGPNINWIVGNSAPLSYVPSKGTSFTENMTFLQRLGNVFLDLVGRLLMMYIQDEQEKMLSKYFDKYRSISDLADRVALVFSNEHYSFDQVKPTVPNIIDIGGIHIEEPKRLPEDLQSFLDDANDGVIYFSLGSNMKSVFLDHDKRDALLEAFEKTRLKVLMKYEAQDMPNTPKNIKLVQWLPQNDVLAHPNVRLFITHGGLLSIIEAIYHGVPIIGIPIFGDQQSNVARAVHSGYALQILFNNITQENLEISINEILSNPKYNKNVKKRSKLLRQRPISPLNASVFWVEHVLEHKGADHLRNWSLKLTWYEYLLLDILGFLVGSFLILLGCVYFGKKKIVAFRRRREAELENKKLS